MQKGVRFTVLACFVGYVCQAIVLNFTPLLYVTFQRDLGLTLVELSFLPVLALGTQLLTDLISPRVVARVGCRASVIAAHLICGAGLWLMTVLPFLLPPFLGIILAQILCNIGAGMFEVLISPIVESCPTPNKSAYMSLLHSFYCWGAAGTILLSTLFFALFGVELWWILYLVWGTVPFLNALLFTRVPLFPVAGDEGGGVRFAALLKKPVVWMLLLIMLAAGAAELTVSQWASTLAETALGFSKTVGDLVGPVGFALAMGLCRAGYARFEHRLRVERALMLSALFCVLGYLLICFSPYPLLSLLGCVLCGFAVGLFWPGTLSLGASAVRGGTALFALMAVAGDLGCMSGPAMAGFLSDALDGNLKMGLAFGMIFPVLLFFGVLLLVRYKKRHTGCL